MKLAPLTILAAILVPTLSPAEDELTSLSYIAYLERYATVMPAHEQEPLEAVINMPLVAGDRLDTAREARVEVQLADGSLLWLDQYTTVSFDAVARSRDTAGDRTVLFLAEGAIMIEVPEAMVAGEPTRVDGGSETVHLTSSGLYRISTLRSGGLRVEVWSGLAEAATTSGGVIVQAESSAEIAAKDVARVEPNLTWGDDFARWVEQRREVFTGESAARIGDEHARAATQLDVYGSWQYVDSLGTWAWQPDVGEDWSPYSAGRWYWTPTGWSWVSYEPWGWLPYHYGSWNLSVNFGWVWSWAPYWSPAWVSWAYWPGYVGWCPYGYYDWWYWDSCHGCYDHQPGHGGGHGSPRPPRDNVTAPGAPRSGATRVAADLPDDALGAAPRNAVALDGRAQVSAIDGAGWNVVSIDSFGTLGQARAVKPGSAVMPAAGAEVALVSSSPLRTAPPSRVAPGEGLKEAFRQAPATRDVTRVLARDPSLTSAELQQAVTVRPRTELAGSALRSAPGATAAPSSATLTRSSSAVDRGSSSSPAARAPSGTLVHRQSPVTAPSRPTGNPYLSRTAREPIRIDGGSVGQTTRPSLSTVTPRTPTGVRPGTSLPSTSRYLAGAGARTAPTVSSRPVIVPRTSPSRIGTSRPVTGSGSSSGSSSIRSPSPSRVAPAAPRSGASTGATSRSGSSGSSARPSTSSGSAQSKPKSKG